MEPSVIGTALMEGGPDRTIKLDRSPGIDEVTFRGLVLYFQLTFSSFLYSRRIIVTHSCEV